MRNVLTYILNLRGYLDPILQPFATVQGYGALTLCRYRGYFAYLLHHIGIECPKLP